MNSKRVFFLLSLLIFIFVFGTVFGAYELNGLFEKQSNKLADDKANLAGHNQEQLDLNQAKKDIAKYEDLYNISRTVVPESKNQAETVRQIVKLANQAGVTIASITFPPSTLGGAAIASGTAASSGAISSGPSAVGGNPSLSQLQAVPKIPGVYQLSLVVNSSTDNNKLATYPELINFLAALEQNRLTALVSSLTITPSTSASGAITSTSDFTFTLSLNIYIKP